jgi:hypothetical protein
LSWGGLQEELTGQVATGSNKRKKDIKERKQEGSMTGGHRSNDWWLASMVFAKSIGSIPSGCVQATAQDHLPDISMLLASVSLLTCIYTPEL